MIIDNTSNVKELASKLTSDIINNIPKGAEARQFNINDLISCNGINKAIINDYYIDNGYIIYSIEWKVKGKAYSKDIRQCDIKGRH